MAGGLSVNFLLTMFRPVTTPATIPDIVAAGGNRTDWSTVEVMVRNGVSFGYVSEKEGGKFWPTRKLLEEGIERMERAIRQYQDWRESLERQLESIE